MYLPHLQEISLDPQQENDPKRLSKKIGSRKGPMLISLLQLPASEQAPLLNFFQEQAKENWGDYHYPYPVYWLANDPQSYPLLRVFLSFSELPPFFQFKDKKPNSKENLLLQKNKNLERKISSLNIKAQKATIDHYALGHKELFRLCQIGHFYEGLLQAIHGSEE